MNLLNTVSIAQAAPAGGSSNMLVSFLPLILMFVIFYLLLIRPQQKRQKALQLMIKNLKKGDKVVTSGGMIGTVWGVAEDKVVLKVGEDEVKLEFEKSSISGLIKPKE
ncbi:MAG: preprotein translocase subunit YajC [Candidatus Omnitrophica bacterium]|nr:preprotein translocase subunit YajC [Candidatus Omnitrophota bacterium]